MSLNSQKCMFRKKEHGTWMHSLKPPDSHTDVIGLSPSLYSSSPVNCAGSALSGRDPPGGQYVHDHGLHSMRVVLVHAQSSKAHSVWPACKIRRWIGSKLYIILNILLTVRYHTNSGSSSADHPHNDLYTQHAWVRTLLNVHIPQWQAYLTQILSPTCQFTVLCASVPRVNTFQYTQTVFVNV